MRIDLLHAHSFRSGLQPLMANYMYMFSYFTSVNQELQKLSVTQKRHWLCSVTYLETPSFYREP